MTSPARRIPRITVLISGSGKSFSHATSRPTSGTSRSNLQALLDASQTPDLPGQVTHVISSRSNVYGLQRAAAHSPPIPAEVCALKTFLNRHPGSTRADYDAEVARRVLLSRPDVVVLAGWMHILSDAFLDILNGVRPPPPVPQHTASSGPSTSSAPTSSAPTLSAPTSSAPTSSAPTSSAPTSSALSKPSTSSAPAPAARSLPEPAVEQTFPIPIINLHPALPGAFDGANAIGRAFAAFGVGEISKTGVMVHRVVREVDRGEPLIVREIEIRDGESIDDLERRIHAVEHEIIVAGAKKVLEELGFAQ